MGRGPPGAEGRAALGSAWQFERKAQAGLRRTLAGFLMGLWQYVFAGLGHLAGLNGSGCLRGRVSGWLVRARGWQRSARRGPHLQAGPLGCQGEPRTLAPTGRWGPRVPTSGEGSPPTPLHPRPGPEPYRPARSFYFGWDCSHPPVSLKQ